MNFPQYIEQIADESGNLSPEDAQKAVKAHGLEWREWELSRPMGALLYEARPLLHWLGY
jgi:hypothetical protein